MNKHKHNGSTKLRISKQIKEHILVHHSKDADKLFKEYKVKWAEKKKEMEACQSEIQKMAKSIEQDSENEQLQKQKIQEAKESLISQEEQILLLQESIKQANEESRKIRVEIAKKKASVSDYKKTLKKLKQSKAFESCVFGQDMVNKAYVEYDARKKLEEKLKI